MKVLFLMNDGWQSAAGTMKAVFEESGVQTDVILIKENELQGCTGCWKCLKRKQCSFDDIVNQIHKEMPDGLIIITESCYGSLSSGLYLFLRRLFRSNPEDWQMKPVSCLVRGRGETGVLRDVLEAGAETDFQLVTAGREYPLSEDTEEDVLERKAVHLAGNMLYLLRCLAEGKNAGLIKPQKQTGTGQRIVR